MIKIIRNKRGSEWTVSKLVSLILLAVVIVLVLVGLSTGALNPLVKKLKDTFNYVLGFFGKSDTGSGSKSPISIEWKKGSIIKGEMEFSELACKITFENNEGIYEYPIQGNSAGHLTRFNGISFDDIDMYSLSQNEFSEKIWKKEVYDGLIDLEKSQLKTSMLGKETSLHLSEIGLSAETSEGTYGFGIGYPNTEIWWLKPGGSTREESTNTKVIYGPQWQAVNKEDLTGKKLEIYNSFYNFWTKEVTLLKVKDSNINYLPLYGILVVKIGDWNYGIKKFTETQVENLLAVNKEEFSAYSENILLAQNSYFLYLWNGNDPKDSVLASTDKWFNEHSTSIQNEQKYLAISQEELMKNAAIKQYFVENC